MKLTDTFWKLYELDLQEVKLSYLNWAIGYTKEPDPRFRHLFLWDHQKEFCIVNSRFGRSFAISPFGLGVRGVPRPRYKGIPRGLDEIDIALKGRLGVNTGHIRSAIAKSLQNGNFNDARKMVQNYFWIKIGAHEILFDQVQLKRAKFGKIRKGRWGLDESEGWKTLTGIRNRIVNVIRYGEELQDEYVKQMDKPLPGFGLRTKSTFLSSALTWNRYGLCAFDCGPVIWSKRGFVHFNQVKDRMNKLRWPYQGTPSEVLRPLYTIALNYRRPPLHRRGNSDEGFSARSLRSKQRVCKIYEIIDNILNDIHNRRQSIE